MAILRYGNNTVSGTGIRYNMNAYNVKIGWKNFFDIEQQPGKSIASGLDVRLPHFRYNGHEVPAVSVQGWIDASQSPGTIRIGAGTNGSVSVELSVGALGSLALVGSGYLYYPAINTFFGKHPQDLSNSTIDIGGSISAVITNVSLVPDNSYQKAGSEYMIPYSMDFVLVSGPV